MKKNRKLPTAAKQLKANVVLTSLDSICTSSNCKVQREFIKGMLKLAPQTTFDLKDKGIAAPAARVKELIDNFGYSISKKLIRATDSAGVKHIRVARYVLNPLAKT